MRKRVYEIIEPSRNGDKPSLAYDIFMLIAITVSIVPLMFVEDTKTFRIIEQITVTIFILDYLLRWITADYRVGKKAWSFVLYPFTGWAIIDLLSILPGLSVLSRGFKILRVTRLLRILRPFSEHALLVVWCGYHCIAFGCNNSELFRGAKGTERLQQ